MLPEFRYFSKNFRGKIGLISKLLFTNVSDQWSWWIFAFKLWHIIWYISLCWDKLQYLLNWHCFVMGYLSDLDLISLNGLQLQCLVYTIILTRALPWMIYTHDCILEWVECNSSHELWGAYIPLSLIGSSLCNRLMKSSP